MDKQDGEVTESEEQAGLKMEPSPHTHFLLPSYTTDRDVLVSKKPVLSHFLDWHEVLKNYIYIGRAHTKMVESVKT